MAARASCEFQVFAKPIGALCNLDCRYCYYLQKRELYPGMDSFRMPEELLESYIIQHLEASPVPEIRFSWHGGEPTLLGLDYFRRIVALQRRHKPSGRLIRNGIQTNGLLLDEQWCRFLAAEEFSIGLSLDGPAELHDCYRISRGQGPSHQQALRGFELLRHYRIPCDILCVVHDRNVEHPRQVYRFFRGIGVQSLSFLPLVERMPDAATGVSPRTVPAEAYGAFLCTLFDEWRQRDIGRIAVQNFDEAARPFQGLEHSQCIFRETCGEIPVLEHNGDFYSCDHFVDPGHRLGNIRGTPLVELLDSPEQKAFGQAKRDELPRDCRECAVREMCHGGCPKDRFIHTPDGEAGLNYLCAGYKSFFGYCRPYFERQGASPSSPAMHEPVILSSPAAAGPAHRQPGRNDPCPCGSGLKYKRCCFTDGYSRSLK